MITNRIGSSQGVEERMPMHRSPWIFFALTLILAAPFWLIGAVTAQLLQQGLGMSLPISSLMVVSPISAAIILLYREGKHADVQRLSMLKNAYFDEFYLLVFFMSGWLGKRPRIVHTTRIHCLH